MIVFVVDVVVVAAAGDNDYGDGIALSVKMLKKIPTSLQSIYISLTVHGYW